MMLDCSAVAVTLLDGIFGICPLRIYQTIKMHIINITYSDRSI